MVIYISSVQLLSHVWLFVTHELQHIRPPCPSPRVYPNSCPSSRWCHPAISSSVVPFSYCPQSLPASGSFPMSQLFTWGGQSTGVSAWASVLPMNTQDWSPLGWTGWISLQSKGLLRVFSNTTVQKHQFFGAQQPTPVLCLENPMHRGTWWAAVHGVAQSQTRLKWLSMHAYTGEGNGSPLQCSCLENPRDGGAWWAAFYGVAQSRTRLKRLSRSSSLLLKNIF